MSLRVIKTAVFFSGLTSMSQKVSNVSNPFNALGNFVVTGQGCLERVKDVHLHINQEWPYLILNV